MEYLIGDFSLITRLSVKTLRFYHQEGLLVPSRIDNYTGYRYYEETQVQTAGMITMLKQLDFKLSEIKKIVDECSDDADLQAFLKKKKSELDFKIKEFRSVSRQLESMIEQEKVEDLSFDPIRIEGSSCSYISIRFHGKYDEVGIHFGTLYKQAGASSAGAPFTLYHDLEYNEEETDLEACIPVKLHAKNLEVKTLGSVSSLCAIHAGSYESIGTTYKKLFDAFIAQKLKMQTPIREFYLKGPGFFFSGNPRRYRTRIEIPII